MAKKKTRSVVLKSMAVIAGLLVVYILIGSIDGPMPQDDDLYVPPPADVPDEQNVRVALEKIVGYDYFGFDAKENARASSNLLDNISSSYSDILMTYVDCYYFDGSNDPDFPIPFEDEKGMEVFVASNRTDFLTLVDTALATNECLAAAFARAAERPYYSATYDRSFSSFNLSLLYGARHLRFIETKQYDEAIKDTRVLLELANKIFHGYGARVDRLYALRWHILAVELLARIASQKDSNEKTLAEIDAVLAKYDMRDWKALCRKMMCEGYSNMKTLASNYSSLSLLDRHKAITRDHPRVPVPFLLQDYLFHPNRTLTLVTEDIRACLAALDDYNSLSADIKRSKRLKWTMFLRPNAIGRLKFGDDDDTLARDCKQIARAIRVHRAYRLLIACRRHFLLTSKLPETAASVSHDLLPEPVLDPVFNIPYEIRTWRDGDKMNVGAFTKGGPEEAASGESGQPASPKDKSISYLSWPIDETCSDKSVSLSGNK